MSERFTPKGIDQTILGVTFEEFRNYSDEEVAMFRERVLAAGQAARDLNEDDNNGLMDVFRLGDFKAWRTYGVPDREVSEWDVEEYMTSLIAAKLADDPTYGKLPDEYHEFSEDQQLVVNSLSQYFAEMREPFEYLTLDDYSLSNTLGLSDEQIDWLTNQGILLPSETVGYFGHQYTLSNTYTRAMHASYYRNSQNDTRG